MHRAWQPYSETCDFGSFDHLIVLRLENIDADFKHEQYLRHWAEQQNGKVLGCDYAQHVTITLALPNAALAELDALSGSLGLSVHEA